MDFDLPAEAEMYRDEVRAFVREHAPGGRFPPDWTVRLAEAGYVAPHWPKPYGRDAGPVQQLVIDEELRAAGAPRPLNPIGIGWAGPTLLVAGTQEQQDRYLPVFLDGVRIPADEIVGEENDGWRLAKVTLGNERVSLSGEGALWGRGPTADTLLDIVRAHGGVSDPRVRQKLTALYIESEVLRLIRLRTVSAMVRGLEPGPETSVRKALADEHGQRVMALAVDLAGTAGMLADRGPFGDADPTWVEGFLYSRALTIGGGTSEVQRNIVGERVLGLPRDPA